MMDKRNVCRQKKEPNNKQKRVGRIIKYHFFFSSFSLSFVWLNVSFKSRRYILFQIREGLKKTIESVIMIIPRRTPPPLFCVVGLVQSVPCPWTGAISISSRALKTRRCSGVRSRSRVRPLKRGCVPEFDLDLDLE